MNDLFERYTSFRREDTDGNIYTTSTAHVIVENDAASRVPDVVVPVLNGGTLAVVVDENTRRVIGDEVAKALSNRGVRFQVFELEPSDGEDVVVCDDARIDEALALLRTDTFTHALAIGSGTINDVVKMASFRAGIEYSVVGTAPSMNGYTSSIAAILSDGVKTTQPCHPPFAAIADPRVMAEAPYRMIASGLGDLYSKPVSNADWRLSHRLLGTAHSDIVMELVEAGSALLDGVAPRLPQRDVEAVGLLTGAIMLSGLAMQAAGTSGPASGGEHLISHYIDMTGYAFDLPHDFHGCQVAVGTVTTSTLYERVMGLDPASIAIDRLVAAHPEWDEHEPVIRQRFGTLSDAVLAHAIKMYPTRDQVRERLTSLVEGWDDIMDDVATTLRPAVDLKAELDAAECPTRFEDIGVVHQRALDSIRFSKDIRARYTILHLASELGVLDGFADRYLSEQSA